MIEQKAGHLTPPSSPKDIQDLKLRIEEATYCLDRIQAEKDAKKDIVDTIKDKYEIPTKQINAIINARYKRNFADKQSEQEDFELLYETLFGGTEASAPPAPNGTDDDLINALSR